MARFVISAFIAFALILFIAGVRTDEVDDERQFEYKEGPKGPENWWKLKEEWWACGHGTQQSPIDVVKRNAKFSPELGPLHRSYYPALATLVNRGHDIMVNWTEYPGSLEINVERCTLNQCHLHPKSFKLYQCHWHHPAEHTIDGEQHPLEIHLVHKAGDGEIAVIGIIYRDGPSDPFLGELMNGLNALANNPNETVELLGRVDPYDIKFDGSKYYRYMGYLTTPACTEGVIWTVIDEIKTVSDDQVKALQRAVHDGYNENARPIQPLNGRKVSMYAERPLQLPIQWSSA